MKTKFLLALLLSAFSVFAADEPAAAPKKKPAPKPIVVPEGIKAEKNIPYVTGGAYRQQLDIYYPEKASGPLPLVVWIHGGGWQQGSKEACPGMFLTTNGFVVASINYRLSDTAKWPAQLQDCKAAIRFLRAHAAPYHIDPKRVGVWGASAGGHLVALLGSTGDRKDFDTGENLQFSSAVQAVCDSCGPTDFPNFHRNPSVLEKRGTNSPIVKLLGGPIEELAGKAREASPITYVSKTTAPLFIIHGDADQVVPLQQSIALNEAAKKAGVESDLYIGKGGGHVFEFATGETRELTLKFFQKHLQSRLTKASAQ